MYLFITKKSIDRSRQLTAMGKEGLYLEDHDDQMSLHHEHEEMSYNQVRKYLKLIKILHKLFTYLGSAWALDTLPP